MSTDTPKTRRWYSFGAAAIFVGGALYELSRLAMQWPWEGFAAWNSYAINVVLAVLWLSTAVAIVAHRAIPRVAWMLSLMAPFAMLAHGLVSRIGGSWYGVPYLVTAVVAAICVRRTWRGAEFLDLRDKDMPQHTRRLRPAAPVTVETTPHRATEAYHKRSA